MHRRLACYRARVGRPVCSNEDGQIDLPEFEKINENFPMLLFGAFRLQDDLQRITLGASLRAAASLWSAVTVLCGAVRLPSVGQAWTAGCLSPRRWRTWRS
jgi:hypothetical protein